MIQKGKDMFFNYQNQNTGTGGFWYYAEGNYWKQFEPVTSKEIDDAIKHQWSNGKNPTIVIPLTKGSYFGNNPGLYFCNVELDKHRKNIKNVYQQNKNTNFQRPMMRKPQFKLHRNSNNNTNNNNKSSHSHGTNSNKAHSGGSGGGAKLQKIKNNNTKISNNNNNNHNNNKGSVLWSWKDNSGWKQYDPQTVKQIESAYSSGKISIYLSQGPYFSKNLNQYMVQFNTYTKPHSFFQMNTSTMFQRKVQRTTQNKQKKSNKNNAVAHQQIAMNNNNINYNNGNMYHINNMNYNPNMHNHNHNHNHNNSHNINNKKSMKAMSNMNDIDNDNDNNSNDNDDDDDDDGDNDIKMNDKEESNDNTNNNNNNNLHHMHNKWISSYRPMTLTVYNDLKKDDKRCSICFCDFEEKELLKSDDISNMTDDTVICLSKCKPSHYFHAQCIGKWLEEKAKCCLCSTRYGKETGNQPPGNITVQFVDQPCSGYNECGTIIATMTFNGGIQTKDHYHPGQRYSGDQRAVYFPDNIEGREAFELTKIAFKRGLIFTIGTSLTTKAENRVVWGSLHFKTVMSGGQLRHGYPDETYFKRYKEELKAKGVTTEDLSNDSKKHIKKGYH